MIRTWGAFFAIVMSAVCATAITMILAQIPQPIGAGAVAGLVCWILFILWPWAVVPAGILGSTMAAVLAGVSDVESIVLVHLAVLGAGALALATRWLVGLEKDTPERHYYRLRMVIVLAITAIGAIYGLAVGNTTKDVLTATYQIAVIPIYFLITLYTLNTPERRRHGALLYVSVISALTALEMLEPGRHGGLLSLLPVPFLIILAGRTRRWRRTGLALLAAGLTADVVLSSYRGLWIAAGIALIILLVLGGRTFARGFGVTALTGGVLVGGLLLTLNSGILNRVSVVGDALDRGAGYRLPEAGIGWDVFLSKPLLGAGLGQTTRDIYIPGFAITDVGPVYHSFYVVILANLGIIGLLAVIWPIAGTVLAALRNKLRDPIEEFLIPLAMGSLTCGFLAAALVESPTDGHWELGLLPALTLLTLPSTSIAKRLGRRGGTRRAAAAMPPVPRDRIGANP